MKKSFLIPELEVQPLPKGDIIATSNDISVSNPFEGNTEVNW